MRRKIYERLVEWKRKSHGETSLLLAGARRVGKSYIVEEFARREYKSHIILDFNLVSEDIIYLFEHFLDDLEQFFSRLSLFTHTKLHERESLIVFDEVQLYPRARAALKYLVKDGRYDYVETGSLVSIRENVKDIVIPSEERQIEMYPMDFEEFLWANGQEDTMDFIRECHASRRSLGQPLHRRTMDAFRQYLAVGGMPQAVEKFVLTHDFMAADEIKRDILQLYRNDMRKHGNGYALKIEDIFVEIPSQLQRHDRVFRLSDISENARMRSYENAFLWLQDAMVANIAFNAAEPSLGLQMNLNRTTLKCYMADTGLLISHAFSPDILASNEIYRKLLSGKFGVNLGMIIENVVAQMLKASGHSLFFYFNSAPDDKASRMEIDFLIPKASLTNRHNISPIEVKSGRNYTLNSLRKFIAKYPEQLHVPFVIHDGDFRIQDGICYLPLYMTPLLIK